MTAFWSGWIMFLVVFNLGITLFLFLWGQRVIIPLLPDGTTGHVWAHGVLRESVRKLPIWWVVLSAAMFVVGIVYLALYPGFGSFKGTLGWTSHGELAEDLAANQARLDPLLKRVATMPLEQVAADPEAMQLGHRLFVDNCAACHGNKGHGNALVGAPDLTDTDWTYGGSADAILASINNGRQGVMPPLGGGMDAAGVENLANYVLSLSGADHWPSKAEAGKASFALCAACHGMDGTGNQALGAPNLTDHTWLYGGDQASIEKTIREGRSGFMPAWQTRLSETDVRLIAGWVYAQSHAKAP